MSHFRHHEAQLQVHKAVVLLSRAKENEARALIFYAMGI